MKGYAILAVIALVALAVIAAARNWSCKPVKPPKNHGPYVVVGVPTGASIEVKAGLAGRRTQTVILDGIAAPMGEPNKPVQCSKCGGTGRCKPPATWIKNHPEDDREFSCPMCNGGKNQLWLVGDEFAERSRANLEKSAGKTIRVEAPRHGLFGAEPEENYAEWVEKHNPTCPLCSGKKSPDGEPSICGEHWSRLCEEIEHVEVEARGPLVGNVYGESGILLNLAQVEAGWVTCLPDAPKAWKAAEKAAKKAKLGMWK